MSQLEPQDVRTKPMGYCKKAILYAVIARINDAYPYSKVNCDRLLANARFRNNCVFDSYQSPPLVTFSSHFSKVPEAVEDAVSYYK
jgi:hypothetical protein